MSDEPKKPVEEEEAPADTPAPQRTLQFFLVSGYIIVGLTILSFLARVHWVIELTCHFRVQYVLIMLLFVPLCAWKKLHLHTTVFAVCLLWNAILVAPSFIAQPKPETAASPLPLKIVLLNVWSANSRHDDVIAYIRLQAPHIIVLQEVTDEWWQSLQSLSEEYPYTVQSIRNDNFGIAVMSRMPLKQPKVLTFSDSNVPSIGADFELDGTLIHLIATHPLPPRKTDYALDRNQQLKAVTDYASGHSNCILIGDLNCTPWSPYFTDLLNDADFRDTRRGFGIAPTWPTVNPLLYIPIDHCLIKGSLTVKNRFIGPRLGSDHLPVIIELE